jgi:ankyrin repeat protein
MTNKSFTDIFDAAACCSVEGVRYFVEQKGVNINVARGEYGYTPLHRAVDGDNRYCLLVIQYLISKGADVNAKGDGDYTPLFNAAAHGTLEVVQCLVSHGADVNAKGYRGETPLHFAASHGELEIVQYFVSHGADVNAKDNDGKTPLDYAKEENEKTSVAEYLTSLTTEPQS